MTTTGRIHTSAADPGWRREQDLLAVATDQIGPDLVVGLARLDTPGDLGADVREVCAFDVATDSLRQVGHLTRTRWR